MLGACTALPAPVIAPGSRVLAANPSLTWAVAMDEGKATISDEAGRVREIKGNTAHPWGNPDPLGTYLGIVMPAIGAFHHGREAWDIGGHAGWRRFGLGGRLRLIGENTGPLQVLTYVSGNKHWTSEAVDGSWGLEFFVSDGRPLAGLFRIGLGAGKRRLAVQVPENLDSTAGLDNQVGAAHFGFFRQDLRLEGTLGIAAGRVVTVSWQPHWVLAHGDLTDVSCGACVKGVQLLGFRQNFGFTLALTLTGP